MPLRWSSTPRLPCSRWLVLLIVLSAGRSSKAFLKLGTLLQTSRIILQQDYPTRLDPTADTLPTGMLSKIRPTMDGWDAIAQRLNRYKFPGGFVDKSLEEELSRLSGIFNQREDKGTPKFLSDLLNGHATTNKGPLPYASYQLDPPQALDSSTVGREYKKLQQELSSTGADLDGGILPMELVTQAQTYLVSYMNTTANLRFVPFANVTNDPWVLVLYTINKDVFRPQSLQELRKADEILIFTLQPGGIRATVFRCDQMDHRWLQHLLEMWEYKKKHGVSDVPVKYKGNKKLGQWCSMQRHQYKSWKVGNCTKLSPPQLAVLEQLDFSWDVRHTTWIQWFEQACAYKANHGNANIPDNYVGNTRLGHWCARQRREYRRILQGRSTGNTLSSDRIAKLNLIGFSWDFEKPWEDYFVDLKSFQKMYGHTNVPTQSWEYPGLGSWCRAQRKEYGKLRRGRQSRLTDDQIIKLNTVGFNWKERAARPWEYWWQLLCEYKNKRGDLTHLMKDNEKLGRWCLQQRREYANLERGQFSYLSGEQIGCLERFGFSDPRFKDQASSEWKAMYEQLCEFNATFATVNVPRGTKKFAKLAVWCDAQRLGYAKRRRGLLGGISDERLALLNNLGFEWPTIANPKAPTWKSMLAEFRQREHNRSEFVDTAENALHFNWLKRLDELTQYKKDHGNFQCPRNSTEYPGLAAWCSRQRQLYKKRQRGGNSPLAAGEALSDERINKLNAIGFVWEIDHWRDKFQLLCEFKDVHGNLSDVLPSTGMDRFLHRWCSEQRKHFRMLKQGLKSPLTDERIKLLDRIGFAWPEITSEEIQDPWSKAFTELCAYKEQQGDLSKMPEAKKYRGLRDWCRTQCKKFWDRLSGDTNDLSDERIQRLEGIGFQWGTHCSPVNLSPSWTFYYNKLCEFQQRFGNTSVPSQHSNYPGLGAWVSRLRSEYSRLREGLSSGLNKEQVIQLNKLGFNWKDLWFDGKPWEYWWKLLCEYKQEHKDLRLASTENSKLGKWCQEVQREYCYLRVGNYSLLSGEQIRLLEGIGFPDTIGSTDSVASWQEMFSSLCHYNSKFGTTRIPRGYKHSDHEQLARWCDTQRLGLVKYRLGLPDAISEDRIALLGQLGLNWTEYTVRDPWDEMYNELKHFKLKHGNATVPRNMKYEALRKFCHSQRRQYRRAQNGLPNHGGFDDERKRLLDDIGFDWGGFSWMDMFRQLSRYKAEYGHTVMGRGIDRYKKLSRWRERQRKEYWNMRNGFSNTTSGFNSRKAKLLEDLGFVWKPLPEWMDMFQELAKFKSKHGHTSVPNQEPYKALDRWTRYQREQYRIYLSSPEHDYRVKLLNDIGFVWEPRKTWRKGKWMDKYEQLSQYLAKLGTTQLPSSERSSVLGSWYARQWRLYEKQKAGLPVTNGLTDEQMDLLDALGIVWEPPPPKLSAHWHQRFEELARFKIEHGHTWVPQQENHLLSLWCKKQRVVYEKKLLGHPEGNNITDDGIALLNGVGFSWNNSLAQQQEILAHWQLKFEELSRFQNEHGHTRVPRQEVPYLALSRWCDSQRVLYRKKLSGHPEGNKITDENIALLNGIGFSWEIPLPPHLLARWNLKFEELSRFKIEHGHTWVPRREGRYLVLSRWCETQRDIYKKKLRGHPEGGRMTDEKIALLNGIGFSWDVSQAAKATPSKLWMQRFEEVSQFMADHGHTRFPSTDRKYETLARWCATHRAAYRKRQLGLAPNNALLDEKVKLLDDIGFPWEVERAPQTRRPENQRLWMKRFEELSKYMAEHGHAEFYDGKNKKLSRWCVTQRCIYHKMRRSVPSGRNLRLDEEQVKLLDGIGFPWTNPGNHNVFPTDSSKDQRWMKRFEEISEFMAEHGHAQVPPKGPYKSLAIWCSNQKSIFSRKQRGAPSFGKRLLDEQVKLLDGIGFPWRQGAKKDEMKSCTT